MAVRTKAARGLLATAAIALALTTAACTSKAADTGADSGEAGDLASVNVALVPGGSHPYFQPWKAAGEAAAEEFGLGSTVFNETAEWDQAKQNEVLNSLAAQGVNAFGIFGVSPTDINTTFKMLKDQGFAVGSIASCPAGDVNEADFCLSTDTEVAAYKAAVAAIEAMGGAGNLVHLTGNNVDSNTQRRIAGVEKAVEETGGAVTLLSTVTDIDVDLGTAQKAVADLLAAKGSEINGFVSTAYNPAVASASAVKESGLPIKVVAIDDDEVILDGIADGSVSATVVQNPTGQAFVGSWVLAQLQTKACTVKDPGVIVDSGSFVVTTDNLETYTDEQDAESDTIMDLFKNDLLDCK
ncbi:sugar ABC transporter substrate-binding protein [Agromyces sp. Root1464]|jgi:ribose transport system substrate-binding protein|uniref:sugar ABC transporter substrate-binding protein n=1 Tax=Agromyces sp. Root1464 TaxID=1736467 RepID=UPI0006F9457E|nr:substrate-binding domain-containing protein [Agromyces sp. Root1464]KQZ07418.1 sugar ABC transporter substrate-binding protein [Agromyces sp. Root1464]